MTPEEAWELIEQDLIPSCREDARTEFHEMLANIWDEGSAAFEIAYKCDHADPWPHLRNNPYRASETA